MKADFLEKQIGQTAEVLIEKLDGGIGEGYSKTYVRVFVKNLPKSIQAGDIVSCKIENANAEFAIANYQK